jgi:hypothetical protein
VETFFFLSWHGDESVEGNFMRSQYISPHLSNVCISKGKNIQVGSNKNVVQRITSMVVRIMYKELLFYENNYYILN